MFQYMARRLIQAIPILIGVSIIVFLIVYAAPGDPTDRFRTPRVPPEQIEALIRSYGLDKPLPEQYLAWVTTFFQVWKPEAWGYSFQDGLPVLQKVMNRLPATFLLMGVSLIVTVILAIPIGILAAVTPVQLDGQDHHHPGHHRVRPAVLPAGHLRALARRRAHRPVDRWCHRLPALRHGEPGQARRSRSTWPGTWCCP